MRINLAVPEAHVSEPVLDGALEAVTRLNEALIEDGAVPEFRDAVDEVEWKPEPPGDEHFDHAAKVLSRGWGDCDDLAPWHAASLRVTGEDPDATAIVKRSGPSRWHAVVRRGDGSIDDPSREAGMGRNRTSGVVGGCLPVMGSSVVGDDGPLILRPQFSVRPVIRGGEVVGFESRVDVPWEVGACPGALPSTALVTLARAPVASQSIVGACRGAVRLAEESDMVEGDVIDRVEVIGHYLDGVPLDELARIYGDEHALAAEQVGAGFFKMLGRGLKKVALPLTKKLVQFIPGIGPVASTALDVAEKGISAAVKAGKGRRRRGAGARAVPYSTPVDSPIHQPSPVEALRILAAHHGMRVSGDTVVIGEDDYDGPLHEVGKFRFGKIFKKVLMPHTLITDRIKSKAMRRILDPSSFVHENLGKKRRRRRRR